MDSPVFLLAKSLLIFLLLITTINASITVTESNNRCLSFNFELGNYTISQYKKDNRTFCGISFDNSTSTLYNDDYAVIPSLSVFIGVPQQGDVKASFVSHSVKRIILEYPLRLEDEDSVNSFYKSPDFNNPWMSNIRYSYFRDMRTGNLYIKPFVYDPQTRVLTILIKGSCTITFPSAKAYPVSSQVSKSDYYAMLKEMILNFDIAKNWIQPKRAALQKRKHRSFLPVNEKMLTFQIGDGNSGVNEATTHENGIVKISGNDIIPFFGSSININTISLWGSYREELDPVVPEVSDIPDGVREIPIMRFDKNRNGIFDPADYILAYVTGISDWYYDTTLHDYAFCLSRFENFRTYWIRIEGNNNTVKSFNCNASPNITLSSFVNRIRYKKSVEIVSLGKDLPKSNMNWRWWRLDQYSTAITPYELKLPDYILNSAGYLRINPGFRTSDKVVSIYCGNILDSAVCAWDTITNLNNPVLKIELLNPSPKVFFEIESFDIKYHRPLDMGGKKCLRIYSPLEHGIAQYQLSTIPAERTFIFRISADESTVSLVDTVQSGGTHTWVDTAGIGIQYFACAESGFITGLQMEPYIPVSNTTYEIRNLRNGNNSSDYLVITHSDFKDEAIRLTKHKEAAGKFALPRIVYIDDIFREFSGGNQDPVAIRNFLLYAHNSQNWTAAPDYVLFLGNGHYDYKGYKYQETNYIPTAQFFLGTIWICIEDFFVSITPGDTITSYSVSPDLFLGRIPCLTPIEAKNAIDKIVETEGPDADFGAWRNKVLLVSDDDKQLDEPDNINHYIHNEYLGNTIKEKFPSKEIRKVILFEYEWNEVYQKPEASRALFNEINNGVSCVNFFGHGNHEAWTQEGILNKDMIGNFRNSKRYPVISAFSCSVGYFDKPGESCLSGLLVTAANAGAIAMISSTRTAFAHSNTTMAKSFYNFLYDKKYSRTIGQAFTYTKALGGISNNQKRYALLGDPSIRFSEITDSVELEMVTEDGLPLHDTLQALQKIKIRGKIVRNNMINSSFGTNDKPAYIQIGLYNPQQDSVTRKDGGSQVYPEPVRYSLPGTPLYIGVLEVKGGKFEQAIRIPRRVTFYKAGASLTAYAWNGQWLGTGFRGNYVFDGTAADFSTDDKEGPRITIRPVYENGQMWDTPIGFTDMISSFLPLECEIKVWDESGIDATSTGPDEGLSIEIDEVKQRENINHKFIFHEGKYTEGHANISFERGELKPDKYGMTIRAQDMLGNISQNKVTLEIVSDEDFKLNHVFTYPNPIKMNNRTTFYFYHSNMSETWHGKVEVTIKIFTLSGKLIRVFHNARNGEVWDLTDQRGNKLSPNVYLYLVTAKMLSTGLSGKEKIVKSPVKKLVILPPG